MIARVTRVVRRVLLVFLIVSSMLIWTGGAPTTANSGGLKNPGFEEGVLDSAPSNWKVQSAPDGAIVPDPKAPASSPPMLIQGMSPSLPTRAS